MSVVLSEAERRLNLTSQLLAVVSSYGGERIVAGPTMDAMVERLADKAEELARWGFLPAPDDPPYVTVAPEQP